MSVPTGCGVQTHAMPTDMQMNGNHLYMPAEEGETQVAFGG